MVYRHIQDYIPSEVYLFVYQQQQAKHPQNLYQPIHYAQYLSQHVHFYTPDEQWCAKIMCTAKQTIIII